MLEELNSKLQHLIQINKDSWSKTKRFQDLDNIKENEEKSSSMERNRLTKPSILSERFKKDSLLNKMISLDQENISLKNVMRPFKRGKRA